MYEMDLRSKYNIDSDSRKELLTWALNCQNIKIKRYICRKKNTFDDCKHISLNQHESNREFLIQWPQRCFQSGAEGHFVNFLLSNNSGRSFQRKCITFLSKCNQGVRGWAWMKKIRDMCVVPNVIRDRPTAFPPHYQD